MGNVFVSLKSLFLGLPSASAAKSFTTTVNFSGSFLACDNFSLQSSSRYWWCKAYACLLELHHLTTWLHSQHLTVAGNRCLCYTTHGFQAMHIIKKNRRQGNIFSSFFFLPKDTCKVSSAQMLDLLALVPLVGFFFLLKVHTLFRKKNDKYTIVFIPMFYICFLLYV